MNARESAYVAKTREEGEDRVGERADGGLLEQLGLTRRGGRTGVTLL